MIGEYNGQITLTINNAEPATDENAVQQKNSLRRMDKDVNISSYYQCEDYCQNNPDCVYFDYDSKNAKCLLYRKEPFKEINGLTLGDCTEFCSKDNTCDYLSHSEEENKCALFSKEEKNGLSSIQGLWADYAIYGYNTQQGVSAEDFYECKEKVNGEDFVFYPSNNYCIPKKFFNDKPGNTSIFFDKTPPHKYKAADKYFGFHNQDVKKISILQILVFLVVIIILFYLFFFIAQLFPGQSSQVTYVLPNTE